MNAYYNENDEFAAAWLRNLIGAGLIAPGEVDARSIVDVRPADLVGFRQCHFFAGIGVWSYSMRLAGWPDTRAGWTGSCPCGPFSQIGRREGFTDERHLWPAFYHLIQQCEPRVVFGEQVASQDGLAWLDVVQSDMEVAGYAFAAFDLSAAGFGAPHIRQRLYWMAHAERAGLEGLRRDGDIAAGRPIENRSASEAGAARTIWNDADWIGCADQRRRPIEPGTFPLADGAPARVGRLRAYGNAIVAPLAAEFIKAAMEVIP